MIPMGTAMSDERKNPNLDQRNADVLLQAAVRQFLHKRFPHGAG
jgi:hypothetical protein